MVFGVCSDPCIESLHSRRVGHINEEVQRGFVFNVENFGDRRDVFLQQK